MSILREIPAAILQEKPDLGTILLKLRFLASRLGSEPLEDWVKFEAEGYPKDGEALERGHRHPDLQSNRLRERDPRNGN